MNGQLKPAYNVQIGTEKQFIIGYSIHQKPTDTTCLKPHLENLKEHIGKYPERVIADAGYGSEENYSYLDEKMIDAYVKFNYFHREQKRKIKKNPYRKENFNFDQKTNTYICPNGRRMHFLEENVRVTDNGYKGVEHYYQCEDCSGCSMRSECHKSQYLPR